MNGRTKRTNLTLSHSLRLQWANPWVFVEVTSRMNTSMSTPTRTLELPCVRNPRRVSCVTSDSNYKMEARLCLNYTPCQGLT